MKCEHENKNIATAMQCMDCGEYFPALHEHQLENTGHGDGHGYTFKEGDIVDFNIIGNTSVEKGTIRWCKQMHGWIIKEHGTMRQYSFGEVFGNPKKVGNVYENS